MIIRKDIDIDMALTASQRKMLNDMQHRPAQHDKDCPELTPEQMKKMNRKENKELKEFENHKAAIVINDDRHLSIDWKDKNGSGLYFINFLIDKKTGTFIVSGDVGYSVACWGNEIDPANLKNIIKSDIDYYASKIKCASDLYIYNVEETIAELNEAVTDEAIEAYLEEDTEFTLVSEVREALEKEVYNSVSGKQIVPTAYLHSLIETIEPDVTMEKLYRMGRHYDKRVEMWHKGFVKACEQLGI